MQKIKRLWYRIKERWIQFLPAALMCLVLIGYALGVCKSWPIFMVFGGHIR